MKGMGIP
jgi:hypothetical protein